MDTVPTSGLRLRVTIILLVTIMIVGSAVFAHIENLPLLDAVYFSIVTVATVGYGDIHPTTAGGKLLAIVLIVVGVGTFLEVIAGITQVMVRKRDKELRMEKVNMIVGLFYAELGGKLLRFFSDADPNIEEMAMELAEAAEWPERRFVAEADRLARVAYALDFDRVNVEGLKNFLERNGSFLLRLLENPTLLEHESFTELLRAIFHLRDELMNREDLDALPGSDQAHLTSDMLRVYGQIVRYWVVYMGYLKKNYPYLFSLAMRTNPFDRNASVIVTD